MGLCNMINLYALVSCYQARSTNSKTVLNWALEGWLIWIGWHMKEASLGHSNKIFVTCGILTKHEDYTFKLEHNQISYFILKNGKTPMR